MIDYSPELDELESRRARTCATLTIFYDSKRPVGGTTSDADLYQQLCASREKKEIQKKGSARLQTTTQELGNNTVCHLISACRRMPTYLFYCLHIGRSCQEEADWHLFTF